MEFQNKWIKYLWLNKLKRVWEFLGLEIKFLKNGIFEDMFKDRILEINK